MKDKLNYKLVNVALIALIIFLLYQTGNLWTGVIGNFFKIMLAFIVKLLYYMKCKRLSVCK